MLFLKESYLRLAHFLVACPAYTGDVWSGLAAVMSYNGLFTYLFFGVLSLLPLYRARLYVLWFGLGATGFLLYAVAELPFATNADAECQAERGARPAEEVSIVSYVSVYYFFYHTQHGTWNRQRLGFYLLIATYWTLSVWALLHLHIQSSLSILSGGALGTVGACLAFWWTVRYPHGACSPAQWCRWRARTAETQQLLSSTARL